jgi:hypothetical protein
MKSHSSSRRDSAGHSWVSNLLWFLTAIAVIFASLRMVNPKLHEYYIEKKIEDIGRFGGANRKPEQIQQDVFDYAVAERIPVKLEDIVVTKPGSSVIVHVKYEETVDLIVVKWPYKVEIDKVSNNF